MSTLIAKTLPLKTRHLSCGCCKFLRISGKSLPCEYSKTEACKSAPRRRRKRARFKGTELRPVRFGGPDDSVFVALTARHHSRLIRRDFMASWQHLDWTPICTRIHNG